MKSQQPVTHQRQTWQPDASQPVSAWTHGPREEQITSPSAPKDRTEVRVAERVFTVRNPVSLASRHKILPPFGHPDPFGMDMGVPRAKPPEALPEALPEWEAGDGLMGVGGAEHMARQMTCDS